jgi:trans-aconitate 2-methyltransferase
MSEPNQSDWDPGTYHRFRGHRLRPALDLLARLDPLPSGDVVDLGCGSGVAAPALRARVARKDERRLIGVDVSPAMIQEATALDLYDQIDAVDITDWVPQTRPALIFSNAALHWLPNHDEILLRLVRSLCPGGMLAVQMPHNNNAPSHRLWRTLAEELSPGGVDAVHLPEVLVPAQYFHILEPLGQIDLWETEYFQKLPASADGHPVRRFTEATYARPILQALQDHERTRLLRAYDDLIGKVYPLSSDGSALFPVRRMFFTLVRATEREPVL